MSAASPTGNSPAGPPPAPSPASTNPAGSAAGPSPARIMELARGFWASKTLLSAVELGVFGALAARPLSVHELRTRLGLHPRSAADFLDALVALGMLEREGGHYRKHRGDRPVPRPGQARATWAAYWRC